MCPLVWLHASTPDCQKASRPSKRLEHKTPGVQGRVQLQDSIYFKWVQTGSYKFGPWTPSKVGLSCIVYQRATLRFSCGENFAQNTCNLEIHLQIPVPSIKMKLLFRQVLDEIGCTLLEETVDTMMAYNKTILHCNLIKSLTFSGTLPD
jgi:hypothetical protein